MGSPRAPEHCLEGGLRAVGGMTWTWPVGAWKASTADGGPALLVQRPQPWALRKVTGSFWGLISCL